MDLYLHSYIHNELVSKSCIALYSRFHSLETRRNCLRQLMFDQRKVSSHDVIGLDRGDLRFVVLLWTIGKDGFGVRWVHPRFIVLSLRWMCCLLVGTVIVDVHAAIVIGW